MATYFVAGAFFDSRAETARGLYRAAREACRKEGIPEKHALTDVVRTEKRGDITYARGYDHVYFDFVGNYFY